MNVKTIAADADGSFAALRNTGLRGPHTDDIADLLLVGSPLIALLLAAGGCAAVLRPGDRPRHRPPHRPVRAVAGGRVVHGAGCRDDNKLIIYSTYC